MNRGGADTAQHTWASGGEPFNQNSFHRLMSHDEYEYLPPPVAALITGPTDPFSGIVCERITLCSQSPLPLTKSHR